MKYVASDDELTLTNGFAGGIPGIFDEWNESPGFCKWMGHPNADSDNIPWLAYEYGSISAKYPDKHTIGKMIRIAKALDAKVIGDDGETWDESYFTNGGYATDMEHRP